MPPAQIKDEVQTINQQIAGPNTSAFQQIAETTAPTRPTAPAPAGTSVSTNDLTPGIAPVDPPAEQTFTPTLAGLTASANNRLTNTTSQLATEQNQNTAVTNRILQLQNSLQGEGARTAELEKEAQLNQRRLQLQEFNNNISTGLAELQAFDAEASNLLASFEGQGNGVSANIIDRKNAERSKQLQREKLNMGASLARQVAAADLLSGQITTAQANIDKAVELEFAPIRSEIETAKWLLERSDAGLERLSNKEQNEYRNFIEANEAIIADRKDTEKQVLAIADEAIRNGAPQSLVNSVLAAKSAQDAQSQAAGYIGLLDREAKIASTNASRASAAASRTNRLLSLASVGDPEAIDELGFDPRVLETEAETLDPTTKRQLSEQVTASDELLDLAGQYRDLLEDKGFENTLVGDQTTVGKYRSLRNQMTAAYKDAKKLGTLDAGLLTLMEGIIGEEPTSGFGFLKNATGNRSDRIIAQIDQLIDTTSKENAKSKLRLGINPTQVDFSTLNTDENAEIDAVLGSTNTSTAQTTFNPGSYFNSANE